MKHPVFLKTGFTTGACACAATVAALESLLKNKDINTVRIKLPNGEFHLFDCVTKDRTPESATVSVIKDSGDDIDITDNVEVVSTVKLKKNNGIDIIGGKGVGICTKEGLAVNIGESAINPIPRKNILENVKHILTKNGSENLGLEVIISIPKGEELAQKTLNSNLGIINGLSILGTTGIVKPMSNEAIVKTIYYELKQVLSQNKEKVVVLVPGNYGQNFALEIGINPDYIVQVSNFIGESLDIAKELGFEKVLLIGDLGKLVKVAGGIFQTHSKVADARMEILAANLAALGAPTSVVNKVLNSTTTIQVIDLIKEYGFEEIYNILADKVKMRIHKRTGLKPDVILFSNGVGLLAQTLTVKELKEFQ